MIFLLVLAGAAAKAGISSKAITLASKLMGATSKATHLMAHRMGQTAGHMFGVGKEGYLKGMQLARRGMGEALDIGVAGLAMGANMGVAQGGKAG